MTDKGEFSEGEDLLPEGVRAKLTADHGEVMAVKTRAGVAAFRVFKSQEYARYSDMIMNEKQRGQAGRSLVLSCCVYPDKQTFLAWLDKYPAIELTCTPPLLKFGGFEAEATQKNYGSA
jgi:hypothetical protein